MKLTIDNRKLEVQPGSTILSAARENDIYIPAICYHPELTPYGGCRLCMVEIDGQRGYPTACTTQVTENMVVRTQSKQLQSMRREMLQLILSEHPSSCMICDENKECGEYLNTIRKVGMTTGCRWCPKDKDCELQKVVEYLEIKDITFPVYYRALEVEKYDPFYDRDYNLCIYCGRCVRICDEYRKSSVIALNQRGRMTTIGPAFGESHIEGDCEFCGACITVCPTGALSEKRRKWEGIPQAFQDSTCTFCGLHCGIQVLTHGQRIIGTVPPGDPHSSGGELCVKGRFVMADLLNHPDRLQETYFRFPEGEGIVQWEEATEQAREAITRFHKGKSIIFLSPDLRTEDMLAVSKFAKAALPNAILTSSCLSAQLLELVGTVPESIDASDLSSADIILSFFFNGNYGYSPTTLAIKRAASNGVPYFQFGYYRDTTSRYATEQISPEPDKILSYLEQLEKEIAKPTGNSEYASLLKAIQQAKNPVIIIGSALVDFSHGQLIIQQLMKLAKKLNAKLHIPLPHGNVIGLTSIPGIQPKDEADRLIKQGDVQALLIFGETPYQQVPENIFVLAMTSFMPPETLHWNVLLPMTLWGEHKGTIFDSHHHLLEIDGPSQAQGRARTIAEFLRNLASDMKIDTRNLEEENLHKQAKDLQTFSFPAILTTENASLKPRKDNQHWLLYQYNPFAYHDVDLAIKIEGLHDLIPSDVLFINPGDAAILGLENNEEVSIDSNGKDMKAKIQIRRLLHTGMFLMNVHPDASPFTSNPVAVQIRRNHV
jgi:NADH dehydrogenase/NADH:ubiquinone oxidoreductase subunit G